MENNPVKYTDPSGLLVNVGIGALIGGITGGVVAYYNNQNLLTGIGVGAATGALAGLTLGASLGVQVGAGVAIGAAAGFGGNLASQYFSGGDPNNLNFQSAAISGLVGAASGGVGSMAGALVDPIQGVLMGGLTQAAGSLAFEIPMLGTNILRPTPCH